MDKAAALKGTALIAVGALGLVALGALGPVFNPRTAAAERANPSWQRPAVAQPAETGDAAPDTGATAPDTGATTPDTGATAGGDFRGRITDMMRDHMGITGEEAEEWAGTMEDMMRSMHGDQADEMLDYCASNGGPGGMMGGSGEGGPGAGWGGMMGGSGGMMGGWGSN